eukprot:CAMPEP_0177435040 /NCGR_PEP_ID=MMETSP0369-20130122/837_1 /TAXON_ID=447022 ORGANISM="Scrippsiella hangoei-like, Strain SHHI-4" /NCGR_SAMPLE_ID=MMETSP0369 /ASSEMBLY_ACC=CAM_ASM_000364 /LENGTH=62 /DNA_ID=CAMNT_0018906169 /DNA_START=591 /DNA_END=776 /DNA_ORIENTATION=+
MEHVGPFDLSWRLSDLALADHGPGVWAEGDAAAATGLEIDDCEADVVRISEHLYLQVDTGAA